MNAHSSSNLYSTSVAANRAWDSSADKSSYPASIRYDDATHSITNLGTSAASNKNQKGLRLVKTKSPSHGALAAALSASNQTRLHRRGRSASETTSPITPTFTSSSAFAPPIPTLAAPSTIHSSPYAMAAPTISSKTKVKIRPFLRKIHSHDKNTIDLSRSAAENEGLGIYTSSDLGGSRKTSSDAAYGGRSYHNRTTSGTSHVSTTTTSSHHPYTTQYTHPLRPTPRPFTPPLAGSFANSLESGSSASGPTVVSNDFAHPDQSSQHLNATPTPYAPLPSPRRMPPPPLHVRTGSGPRLTSSSQTNLPGTPSSLRHHHTDNPEPTTTTVTNTMAAASTRTSFESSIFRKRSRANTSEDPVVRAAQVAILRKEFDERERLKDESRREQEARKAVKEAKKQQRRDESLQRKSERKRNQSNAADSEIEASRNMGFGGGEKVGYPGEILGEGRPQSKGKSAGGAGKAVMSKWQLFVFWLKTVFLKMKRKTGTEKKGSG
ncbi:MAG: hypothetical protein Q9220_005234 [cf. Caloplaca sp. 1 TL-2023]